MSLRGEDERFRWLTRVTLLLLRFLGYVDLIGTTYTSSTIATGYGAYMCVEFVSPSLDRASTDDFTLL